MAERVHLLGETEEGIRRRPPRRTRGNTEAGDEDRWEPPPESDWDPDQPYGGKVYLARIKKPDPWWVLAIEIIVLVGAVAFSYYTYYHFEHFHYHVTKGYAHLGYSVAQHQVGQKLLHGQGVEKDQHKAMEWFKKAADQGHPEASYSLAVGHIRGIRKDLLEVGEAHKLIAHAAANGIEEAQRALNDHCVHGRCE